MSSSLGLRFGTWMSVLLFAACGSQATPRPGSSGSGSGGSSDSGASSSSGGASSGGSSGASGGSGSGAGSGGSGGSGSSSGSSSGSGFCQLNTTTSPVDTTLCKPQLQTATSCGVGGTVCGFTVEIPCLADIDGGLESVDAGTAQCNAWCNAAAPSAEPYAHVGSCTIDAVDGGTVIVATCDGCGL